MLTTRELLGIIQEYMDEQPKEKILMYLNRAYLRLCQNDIKDFVFLICRDDFGNAAYDNDDLKFSYPVLRQKYNKAFSDEPPDYIPMPSSVDIVAENFTDEDGNLLLRNGDLIPLFIYRGQIVTCRKVNAFFVIRNFNLNYYYYPVNQVPYKPFTPYFNGGYIRPSNTNRGNLQLSRFPCDLRPPTQDKSAFSVFFDKPYGDATDADESNNYLGDVYCEFWFTPPSLATPDSVMLLDTDKWQDELINGAVGYYEDMVNGDSTRLKEFLKFNRKEFMNEGNSNIHNKGNQQYKARDIG